MPPTRRRKPRSPGRPSHDAGPAITRAQLVAIAARVVAERGFDRASVREIAKEAGVSHGTVQHHFPTKPELWRAIVDDVIVPRLRDSRAAGATDVGATIASRVKHRVETAVLQPGLSAAILTDASPGSEERLRYLAEAMGPMRAADLEAFRALQAAGLVRPVDVDAIAVVLGIALASLSSSSHAVRVLAGVDVDDPEERARLASGIADLLLNGLLPR